MHYRGSFENGDEFDSSYKREKPFIFEVGQNRVIKCWDQAFPHLTKGQKARLHCPSDYAYGSGGAGRIIPPNADLFFDIELVDINPPEEIAKKISLGKMNKFKEENALLTQAWVMEPKKKVQDVLKELAISDLKIKEFSRIKIGE